MEGQVSQLEARLRRREQELGQALAEGRGLSKLERARLEGLHAAELRERDEQLLRFQMELEGLVLALRQWQGQGQGQGQGPGQGLGPEAGLPVGYRASEPMLV